MIDQFHNDSLLLYRPLWSRKDTQIAFAVRLGNQAFHLILIDLPISLRASPPGMYRSESKPDYIRRLRPAFDFGNE